MANKIISSFNTMNLIDYGRTFPGTSKALGVAGYAVQPALSFADQVCKKIISKANPWKWNIVQAPVFYTQPFQQDFPTSITQEDFGWQMNCVALDINNPQSSTNLPIILPIEAVQYILPTFLAGFPRKISWVPNAIAQTGTWGGGAAGKAGSPGPNAVYTNPLISQGGGPSNNPVTAITDPNGNILTVTTYGICGPNPPAFPAAGAAAGTTVPDGTVVWTVQDPNGIAWRLDLLAVYGSNVFEMHPIYQAAAPNLKTLSQTFAPIPDFMYYLVQQGFLAYCHKVSNPALFQEEYTQWEEDIQTAMMASDRERQEFGFYPESSIQGWGPNSGVGTFGYVGWPGWS